MKDPSVKYCDCDLITVNAIQKEKSIECSNCHKRIVTLKVMFYEIRIEPKQDMTWDEVQKIIKKAFEKHGGLYSDGLELINSD